MRGALRLCTEAEILPVVLADAGGVLAYGRTRRLASRGQRLALAARDEGCVFPGCDAPPGWCEVHHDPEWVKGGRTDLDQMALLCRHHHRLIGVGDWELVSRSGVPWFRPPERIDTWRRLVRNRRGEVSMAA